MKLAGRPAVARVLVVAASVGVVLSLLTGYASRTAFNSQQFANRATVALEDDSVRSLVAQRVTDEVVLRHQSDLIAARPIIESVASAIVGSRAFTGLFRAGVRDVHRAVFNRDRDTVTLTVADVGTVLAAALQKLRPSLAAKVESTDRVDLIRRDIGSFTASIARTAKKVKGAAALTLLLTLLLIAAALVVGPDKRQTVRALGIGLAAGGVVVLLAYSILRSLATHQPEGPEAQAAAGAVWDAFLGDLRTAAWLLAGSGAVVAAAAASLIKPIDIGVPLRRVAAWVTTEPDRTPLRVLRAVVLLAAGLLVITQPDAVLSLALTLVGVYLVYEGVSALLRLVYRAPAPELEPRAARPPSRPRVSRRVVAASVGAVLVVGAVAGFFAGGGATTAAPAAGPCDGHAKLCDRTLDRLVLPATHNSMSVPLPGWYSAEQDHPIAAQLADGVRGLLIDAHYADRLKNGKLRTYFGSDHKLRQAAKQDGVSPDAVAAALRLRERIGYRGKGERGMYFCHTFCELGGTPVASVLDDIHDFLISHPGDIVVVINQDYVTPKDFVAAVERAELGNLVYRGPTSGRLPTLQELIDKNQRAIFLAENKAGAAPWYRLAYKQMTEETPYNFPQVGLLTDPARLPASCKPNRGPAGAPVFLLNHWISTDPVPRPSDARKVNAYDPLLRRARECQRLRKHVTNLVAVNFYRQGDVFRVVDTLNGVGGR